ncbi:MAG TPA: response regulator [Chitinispirillaceae bacterium]|nr:response regulator [Chitinispirillaceae bacterium]
MIRNTSLEYRLAGEIGGGSMAKSIVLVDDFPLTLQFIEYHLEQAGYTDIIKFENPLDVISYIQNGNNPLVIVTDFQMPQMNGVELLDHIRSNLGVIPAIITTADHSSLTPGADLYPILEKGSSNFIADLLVLLKKLTSVSKVICITDTSCIP